MNNFYEKEMLVTAAYVDPRCEVGVFQATVLLQDCMTELFYQYQCDAIRLSRSHGVVWAVARTKLRCEKPIRWMDRIRLKAFPVKVSSVAVHLNLLVESLDGTPLLRARQEMCAIDVESHRLRRMESTPFPMDMDLLAPAYSAPYVRMKLKLGQEALVYSYRARAMDTDMNGHINNVNYLRFLLDARPVSFWAAHTVREVDIHYVKEGREGDELEIYCQEEPQALSLQIKRGEETLIKAFLMLEDRA